MATIYALADPDSGALRYIGKANCPAARLATHLRDARRLNRPVCLWVRSILQAGKQPEMVVIREHVEAWEDAERQLIASARAGGHQLLNVADGGAQPGMTPEQRKANGRKMVAIMRGEAIRKGTITAEQLVIETSEWLCRHAIKIGSARLRDRTLRFMADKFRERPEQFGRWSWVVKYV